MYNDLGQSAVKANPIWLKVVANAGTGTVRERGFLFVLALAKKLKTTPNWHR